MEVTVQVPHYGVALRVRRKALGLSQWDVADRLGMDQARISMAEHNYYHRRRDMKRIQAAYARLLEELEAAVEA